MGNNNASTGEYSILMRFVSPTKLMCKSENKRGEIKSKQIRSSKTHYKKIIKPLIMNKLNEVNNSKKTKSRVKLRKGLCRSDSTTTVWIQDFGTCDGSWMTLDDIIKDLEDEILREQCIQVGQEHDVTLMLH